MMVDSDISNKMRKHYRRVFKAFGPTSRGVDWGEDGVRTALRQEKLLSIICGTRLVSLLDVGCGYGDLASVVKRKKLAVTYSGIDVVPESIKYARRQHPENNFFCGDILSVTEEFGIYDYVVCNGILTQKLDVSALEMNKYASALIKKMFSLCKIGIAFNLMSTYVNFYAHNLYYRNPAELLAWCMTELTPHARIDASYMAYEYSVYLYKPIVLEESYA